MNRSTRKWFSLAEIIVSITLITWILVIGYNKTLGVLIEKRSISNTAEMISNKIENTLSYAISWYGWKSLDINQKDSKELLPESFVIYFSSNSFNDTTSWYFHTLETQNRVWSGIKYMRTIKNDEFTYLDPNIYLKNIVWKIDESDTVWEKISSIWISFLNPTGKTFFFPNNTNFIKNGNIISSNSAYTINEFLTPVEESKYSIIELEFYRYDQKVFIQKIYRDKRFPINIL
jgi:hypothetical protein